MSQPEFSETLMHLTRSLFLTTLPCTAGPAGCRLQVAWGCATTMYGDSACSCSMIKASVAKAFGILTKELPGRTVRMSAVRCRLQPAYCDH